MSEPETSGPRRVTRADVARRAGVSTAAVSYVLNGSAKVSEATRARVLAAVAELGYRPNAAARALKLGSAAQLGLVVPGVLNRFFAELTDLAERAAATHGLALVVTSARDGVGPAIGRLASRQVDGVLVATGVTAADLAPLAGAGIPAAVLDHVVEGVTSIGVDRYQGARDAVEHLLGHGHRRVGFVGPDEPGRRRQAWTDALAAAGVAAEPLVAAEFTRGEGYRAGRALAAMPDRPSAVFVTSDDQAIGVLLALHEAGVRVPEDVAIASFDGSQESAYCWPPLTTAAQPSEEMVRIAVDRLVAREPGQLELPARLVVRRSCGCTP
ncbi:MAG TPA: LacI family DNA-binding transcriptional regulator [Actinotalea caeni]|uniref:LacI family DNA-binding transcriptional regulator n=1 Tax=Actinotalea caeni TaxID=1348467 RepID=UPI0012E23536|nr:LacI family DNA-binding transcriptional regulator [Actinotalea caeni]HLV55610.1 LacI family DNA-binding transcriptional regulator [Actinotalea caeni]